MKELSAPITGNVGPEIPTWKPKQTTTFGRRIGP